MINLMGSGQSIQQWRIDIVLLVFPTLVRKLLLDLVENHHREQRILIVGLDKSKLRSQSFWVSSCW